MQRLNAFVLSGGSIKGSFQAGVLIDLLTSHRFIPNIIIGTSVGSLNGAFIADRAGRAKSAGKEPDWVDIGNQLQDFWLNNVTSFDKLGKRRSKVSLIFAIAFKNYCSLLKMDPLYELLEREIKIENLKASPVKFYACAVNIFSGQIVYAIVNPDSEEAKELPDYSKAMIDYIIASTAIPMVMPPRIIHDEPHVDGGIREVVPLSKAIEAKASHIISVVCQTRETKLGQFDFENALTLMDRHMELITDEIVRNDVEHCEQINAILRSLEGSTIPDCLKDKKYVEILEIRPVQPLEIDLEKFTRQDIEEKLEEGKKLSQEYRQQCDWLRKASKIAA
jgi:NTE family protein